VESLCWAKGAPVRGSGEVYERDILRFWWSGNGDGEKDP
jgi:hypothetical protein